MKDKKNILIHLSIRVDHHKDDELKVETINFHGYKTTNDEGEVQYAIRPNISTIMFFSYHKLVTAYEFKYSYVSRTYSIYVKPEDVDEYTNKLVEHAFNRFELMMNKLGVLFQMTKQ